MSAKKISDHEWPGFSHEYLEAFDSYLPGAGIEYYYYDQLGSAYSDKPEDPELWELPRFVEEVEQVRKALGLDASNFYLYGQSWGGILAMEYALAHGDALKGLVIANMVGAGVFLSAGFMAQDLGSGSILIAWVINCLRHTFGTAERNVGRTVSGLLAGIILVDLLAVGGGSFPMVAGFSCLFVLALLFQRFIPAT